MKAQLGWQLQVMELYSYWVRMYVEVCMYIYKVYILHVWIYDIYSIYYCICGRQSPCIAGESHSQVMQTCGNTCQNLHFKLCQAWPWGYKKQWGPLDSCRWLPLHWPYPWERQLLHSTCTTDTSTGQPTHRTTEGVVHRLTTTIHTTIQVLQSLLCKLQPAQSSLHSSEESCGVVVSTNKGLSQAWLELAISCLEDDLTMNATKTLKQFCVRQ